MRTPVGSTASWLAAVALSVGLACGGGSGKPAEKPDPDSESTDDAATPVDRVATLCASVCARIGAACADDPTVEFDKPGCEEVCAGQTDGVLEDTDLCTDGASTCESALECGKKLRQ